MRAFYQAQERRRLTLYNHDSDCTTDSHTADNSDSSGSEDLDVVSNREGDAVRNSGERRSKRSAVLASPGPEDLDDVVSNREGDAIRSNTLEPGKSGNAGERRTESATVLASPGRDVSPAGQLAPRPVTAEVSDDPMFWTVDKVAQKLRDEPSISLPPPERAALAESLSREGICGRTLLCHVTMQTVRDDLNIRNVGQAASIVELVDKLREKSDEYSATACYTVPRGISAVYAAGRKSALERKRRRLRGEECPEYKGAIDAIERIQQLEAELQEARSALASREPLDGTGNSSPRKRRRVRN